MTDPRSGDPPDEPTLAVPSHDLPTRVLADDLVDATLIGRGGFGTVYRAREQSLDRFVAVKVMSGEYDDGARARFLREGRAMAALAGHPNIVAIHRLGVSPQGEPFLVMPYHPAGSLDRNLIDERLPWTETVRIGVRLAGAMAAAHQAGVLHLDIKPANVLLSELGEPLLADFGVAKIRADATTRPMQLTASVAYAAPEVIEGREPTTAADVYSLGSTLYALLAGRAAFAARLDESFVSQCFRVINDPVAPIAGIPAGLFDVVSAAMAKDPRVRPSAIELGRALQLVQRENGHQPTEMVPAMSGRGEVAFPLSASGAGVSTLPELPDAGASNPPDSDEPSATGDTGGASAVRSDGGDGSVEATPRHGIQTGEADHQPGRATRKRRRTRLLVGVAVLLPLLAVTALLVVRRGGNGQTAGPGRLRDPRGITIAPDGALVVADTGNHRVLRIAGNGSISVIAGSGKVHQSADGLNAVEAELDSPSAVAYAEDGTLAIATGGAIRLVDRRGILSTVPTPVATSLRTVSLLRSPRLGWYVAEPSRVLLVSDDGDITVVAGGDTAGFAGDGGPANAARLAGIRGLALDADERLLITDSGNDRVRRLEPDGTITTLYGGADASRLGSTRAEHVRLSGPVGLATGTDGTVFVGEQGLNRVRAFGVDGSAQTIAGSPAGFTAGFSGDGGPAVKALFDRLGAIAVGQDGSLFVCDERNNRVRRISPTGVVSTVA